MRVSRESIIAAVVLAVAAVPPATGQSVISARAGLVNFTEGPVLVNGKETRPWRGVFPQMAQQDTLRTNRGRAELLLNPGAFLRVGRDSSVRLLSNELTDSRVELVDGSLLLEAAEVSKDTTVALQHGEATVSIRKNGIYRLDSDPPALRVFSGKAVVESGGQRIEAGKGRMVSLGGTLAVTKFDRKKADSLDLWSKSRAEYLANASLSASRSLQGRGRLSLCNGWCFYSGFGIITYLPLRGTYLSPYGYYFVGPQSYTSYIWMRSPGGGGGAGPVSSGMGSMGGGSSVRGAAPASISAPSSDGGRAAPAAPAAPSRR